jgi:aldose 1-epimerase
VPDRDGRTAEVVLALADPADHVAAGALLADRDRVAHGVWHAAPFLDGDRAGLRLERTGPMPATVTYTLLGNEIRIDRSGTGPTGHVMFNLAGEGSGTAEGHELHLAAGHYLPVDPTRTATGRIDPVAGTPMDFTRPTPLGARVRDDFVQLVLARGYDHGYVLDRTGGPATRPAARVREPGSGRRLSVFTTAPWLRLYSGNRLDGTLAGTGGRAYRQSDGFVLEPQFPSTALRPGETHRSSTVYRFDAPSAAHR